MGVSPCLVSEPSPEKRMLILLYLNFLLFSKTEISCGKYWLFKETSVSTPPGRLNHSQTALLRVEFMALYLFHLDLSMKALLLSSQLKTSLILLCKCVGSKRVLISKKYRKREIF